MPFWVHWGGRYAKDPIRLRLSDVRSVGVTDHRFETALVLSDGRGRRFVLMLGTGRFVPRNQRANAYQWAEAIEQRTRENGQEISPISGPELRQIWTPHFPPRFLAIFVPMLLTALRMSYLGFAIADAGFVWYAGISVGWLGLAAVLAHLARAGRE